MTKVESHTVEEKRHNSECMDSNQSIVRSILKFKFEDARKNDGDTTQQRACPVYTEIIKQWLCNERKRSCEQRTHERI
jgi:hypothetical protein